MSLIYPMVWMAYVLELVQFILQRFHLLPYLLTELVALMWYYL